MYLLALSVPLIVSHPCVLAFSMPLLRLLQAFTIVGGGRVGQALADMGQGGDVSTQHMQRSSTLAALQLPWHSAVECLLKLLALVMFGHGGSCVDSLQPACSIGAILAMLRDPSTSATKMAVQQQYNMVLLTHGC